MNIKNKIILVTGGAVRVGREITINLTEAGGKVYCHYNKSQKQVKSLAEFLGKRNYKLNTIQADPLGLLHTVRLYADRIRIFCQAGQIKIPRDHQLLLSHLEGSVFEVAAPREDGVFHPKVWALRFQMEGQPTLYRLLVLSRNLTFDRSRDTSLVLDGED